MLLQWCIAKNGGGYTQRGVARGLMVPCLFMITEASIRCQKNPEVGVRRMPAYTPPQYTTAYATTRRGIVSERYTVRNDARNSASAEYRNING